MGKTKIEWASHSWNPYSWNCTKVSPGCANCYAESIAQRYGRNYAGAGFGAHAPVWIPGRLKQLRTFPTGAVIFVNSMSDTWHERVPMRYVMRIHRAAEEHPDKIFLVLTKRPHHALARANLVTWPDNLWIGTSVEDREHLYRLDDLLRIPAAGHFLSAEPLLGPLGDDLLPYLRQGLGWVIVGGESGNKRRAFNKMWAADIQKMCKTANVPFMFKQGSAYGSGKDRMLNGQFWDETPFKPIEAEPEIVQGMLL